MKTLSDPRHYKAFSSNSLVTLAAQIMERPCAMQQGNPLAELSAAIGRALHRREDALVERALAQATSQPVYRLLADALDDAVQAPGDADLSLRLFAIPILLVTGGFAPIALPGVVTDVAELTKLFASHGTLGAMKNFALSASLVSAAGLAALGPGVIYRRSRNAGQENSPPLDLAPEAILITDAEEAVHLRFLTGVSVTAPHAPGFGETAGNIGAWGMPLTRALAARLGQPGLSLLPIPRPPMSLLRALEAGQFAESELRFQLFLSNALRKFRSRVGEAQAQVAAFGDASIRVRLVSPFDASMTREFAWLLRPGDDLAAVCTSIFSLLDECRVSDIEVAEAIQPAAVAH